MADQPQIETQSGHPDITIDRLEAPHAESCDPPCTACDGSKVNWVHYDGVAPETGRAKSWNKAEKCVLCQGSGLLDLDTRNRIQMGKNLEADWTARGLDFRQEADRVGMRAITLHVLRRGMVPMSVFEDYYRFRSYVEGRATPPDLYGVHQAGKSRGGVQKCVHCKRVLIDHTGNKPKWGFSLMWFDAGELTLQTGLHHPGRFEESAVVEPKHHLIHFCTETVSVEPPSSEATCN